MAWVVDTCLLIDVAVADPTFLAATRNLLQARLPQGLTICPISYVELAPVFQGDRKAQDEFLFNLDVSSDEPWVTADTNAAHAAWNQHVAARRAHNVAKRPIADVMIGAFASRFDGLLTRNDTDFRRLFPSLQILVP
jgi:predicted nucleic acid-binding protein